MRVRACVGFGLLICGGLEAQPQDPADIRRVEVRTTDSGVRYISAGIGRDSRANLPRYGLKLIFATRTSHYIANVEAEISPGPGGKAIRIRSLGPWLLVDLQPGNYAVTARAGRRAPVTRSFQVSRGKVTELTLVWNLSDAEI